MWASAELIKSESGHRYIIQQKRSNPICKWTSKRHHKIYGHAAFVMSTVLGCANINRSNNQYIIGMSPECSENLSSILLLVTCVKHSPQFDIPKFSISLWFGSNRRTLLMKMQAISPLITSYMNPNLDAVEERCI